MTLMLAGIWLIPGVLGGLLAVAVFPLILRGRSVGEYVTMQVLGWAVWALLTPAIVALAGRYRFERAGVGRAAAVHTLAAIVCGVIYTIVSVAVGYIGPRQEWPSSFVFSFRNLVGLRLSIGIVVYCTIVGVATAIDERQARRQVALRALRLENELTRAQLQSLQMQLQPHFLFNTLHAIGLLVRENQDAAVQMVGTLADLLRHTLALANVPQIPLEEELGILRRYLEIEETRFADRLTVSIDVPDDLLDASVPTLILQPLVENAVRHGVAQRFGAARVAIGASRRNGTLCLVVEDDGPGFAEDARSGGTGLSVSRDRLTALYGDRASLRCENVASGGARVVLQLPIDVA